MNTHGMYIRSHVVCLCRVPVFSTWRANWDLWMENTMDPSHVNWLHDGTAGKWEDAYPMKMRLLDNAVDAHKVQPAERKETKSTLVSDRTGSLLMLQP